MRHTELSLAPNQREDASGLQPQNTETSEGTVWLRQTATQRFSVEKFDVGDIPKHLAAPAIATFVAKSQTISRQV